jgi:hypothetical protein
MSSASDLVGTVWSHRDGRVVVGRLRGVDGRHATLAVVGLGFEPPPGAEVLPLAEDGAQCIRIRLKLLLGRWKRIASPPDPGGPA